MVFNSKDVEDSLNDTLFDPVLNARAQKMKNSDLFGKLFKEIGVKFVGDLCM